MRIGTWNLDARWDGRHLEFLQGLECDLLLLTEVHVETELPGMVGHHTQADLVEVLARLTTLMCGRG